MTGQRTALCLPLSRGIQNPNASGLEVQKKFARFASFAGKH